MLRSSNRNDDKLGKDISHSARREELAALLSSEDRKEDRLGISEKSLSAVAATLFVDVSEFRFGGTCDKRASSDLLFVGLLSIAFSTVVLSDEFPLIIAVLVILREMRVIK
jgi:hypothetical protein